MAKSGKNAAGRRKENHPETCDIESLTERLGIRGWDVLLVADGSGSDWGGPCGWCCAMVDRHSGDRKLFTGGMSHGTPAIAELFPVFQAMLWLSHSPGPWSAMYSALGRPVRIHIVTDNLKAVEIWAKLRDDPGHIERMRNYAPIWRALSAFQGDRFDVTWHWVPRQTFALHVLADLLSKGARMDVAEAAKAANGQAKAMAATELPRRAVKVLTRENLLRLCNPDPFTESRAG